MAEPHNDALTITLKQLKNVLPTTAAKLGKSSDIVDFNPRGVEVGTIMVSKTTPSALDVIRFFQVVEIQGTKLFIKEIHQLNKYEQCKGEKIGLCAPLKGIFLCEKPTIVDVKNDGIYLDGVKLGEKLPYDVIDIGTGIRIKVYAAQIYTPLF